MYKINWLSKDSKIFILLKIIDHRPIGMINYIYTFSSFQFILEEHRGQGYGEEFFIGVRNVAKEVGCSKVEWLDFTLA